MAHDIETVNLLRMVTLVTMEGGMVTVTSGATFFAQCWNTFFISFIHSFNNFKPDLVVLGHADRVSTTTLQKLKEINKDILLIYIESLVPFYGSSFTNMINQVLKGVLV